MSTRPPFIAVFIADTQGCGTHRGLVPLGALMAAGLAEGRADVSLWPEDVARAAKPDVVVWQRQVEHGQFDMMRAYRRALPDAFHVYELDDYLGAVPEGNFHSGFMPPNLEDRIRIGLSLCDAATTTTEPMAEWLRGLGATDVRVIPNVVPMARLHEREIKPGAKLRIGWGGGISHDGDLSLLLPAMQDIGDEVQWVFLGMQPENAPVPVEFHEGVAPFQYLDKLGSLDLDLILAPLEDNLFNRCKSNLRLIEAGAVNAAVIAQHIDPYLERSPPVFAYCNRPEDWAPAIRKFIGAHVSERKRSAKALQSWVSQQYTAEARIHDRLAAWTPTGAKNWRPHVARQETESVVIACATPDGLPIELPPDLRRAKIVLTLAAACERAVICGADVLWLRPGTELDADTWVRLRGAIAPPQPIASAIPLASDGPNAFPRERAHTPLSPVTIASTRQALVERVPGLRLGTPTTGGPCVLLNRHALAMFGTPDVDGLGGNEEIAILEWGMRCLPKGWGHVQVADAYVASVVPPATGSEDNLKRLQARGYGQFMNMPSQPLSVADREAVELKVLRKEWGGLRPGVAGFPNDYATWAMLRGDINAPAVPFDNSLGVLCYGEPVDGSWDWIVFHDPAIQWKPGALNLIEQACVDASPDTFVIYGDHETKVGESLVPDFKSDFDRELLLGRDYITRACAVRSSLVAGRDIKNRMDLYAAILSDWRCGGPQHIPQVLATAEDETPEQKAADAVQRQAILERLFDASVTVKPHRAVAGALSVQRSWKSFRPDAPLVSIIVPTKGNGWMLQPCINTLLRLTRYPNFEILVVCNGNNPPELGEAENDPRVRWMYWKHDYNWSALNNAVAKETPGEFLLFVNDDVRVGGRDWLDAMMGHAVLRDVGAVGARLVYPHGLVQHVGVVCHEGAIGHLHKGLPSDQLGYQGIAMLTHETQAVTGACLLVARDKFDAVGGFDESLAHNYNDIMFCLALREKGYRNVVEVSAELLHLEGATRTSPQTAEGMAILRADTAKVRSKIGKDPYWNPNFALMTSADGVFVQGLGCEMLAWEERKTTLDQDSVLIINDTPGAGSAALVETKQGAVAFLADLSGFALRLMAPAPANTPGWDIRDPRVIRKVLDELGIKRIILRSLVGVGGPAAAVESLRGLAAIGLPVDYRATDDQLVCPRLDMTRAMQPCGELWRKGIADCQACVNEYGSPFGKVDVAAWWQAWAILLPPEPEKEAAD